MVIVQFLIFKTIFLAFFSRISFNIFQVKEVGPLWLDLSAYGRKTKLAPKHMETLTEIVFVIMKSSWTFLVFFYLLFEKKDKLFVTHLRCHPFFVWILKPVSIPVISINQSRCCSFNVILVNQWNSEFRFCTHESEILDSCDQRLPPPFFPLPNPSRASGTQGIVMVIC